jgi:ribosome-associated protein
VQPEDVLINTPTIQLDQFLKWAGVAGSGGEAKMMTENGLVAVNGAPTHERRKRLHPGDVVSIEGSGSFRVVGG